MKKYVCIPLAFALLSWGGAAAEARIEETRTFPLTQQERKWVAGLSKRLGVNLTARSVAFDFVKGQSRLEEQGPHGGRGLVATGRGIEVKRLRFRSSAVALEVGGWLDFAKEGEWRVLEVRGRQLVLIGGERVQKGDQAGRALIAAWEGLPSSKSRDLTAVTRGNHQYAGRTVRRGPFHGAILDAIAKANEKRALLSSGDLDPLGGSFESDRRMDVWGTSRRPGRAWISSMANDSPDYSQASYGGRARDLRSAGGLNAGAKNFLSYVLEPELPALLAEEKKMEEAYRGAYGGAAGKLDGLFGR